MTTPSDPAQPRRSELITERHLRKFAVVYMRQSSPGQVREHTGSTAVQRSLADRARQLGWAESLIKTIDEDLGLSGTSSYQRSGFQQLLQLLDRDEVGLVLVHDVSRLSRHPHAAEEFLMRAVRGRILIEANGHLFEAGDRNLPELFGFRIKSLLAWWGNAFNVESFRRAKEAKVPQGFAVTRPPIGYVKSGHGQWQLDPDVAVQEAIRRLFDLYLKFRSIRRVALYFVENHLLFPRRVKGRLLWQPITAACIASVLKNPQYCGDYFFQRTRVIPSTEARKKCIVRRPQEEWLVKEGHHPAYVSRTTWEEIQKILSDGRIAHRQPIRNGAALLQDIVWCRVCDRGLGVRYTDRIRTKHLPLYLCATTDRLGNSHFCFSVAAAVLDSMVVRRVLSSVTPATIDEAIAVTQAAVLEHERVHKAHARLLQRAEDEVEEVQRRWLLVEPQNHGVQKIVQDQLEAKTQERDRLKRALEAQRTAERAVLAAVDAEELVRLSQDVERLWTASTTENADRKRLLRTLISRVVLTTTDEWIDVDIVWNGGAHEEFRILRSKGINTYIAGLRSVGGTDGQIEARLRDEGIMNSSGRSVSRNAIGHRLAKMAMNTKATRRPLFQRVRELALDGRTRPEMLTELRQHGPRHPLGDWTRSRLDGMLYALSSGENVGVDPLPAGFKFAVLTATNDELISRIALARQEKRPWSAIAADLNEQGVKPLRARAFSKMQIQMLFRRADRRSLIPVRRLRRTGLRSKLRQAHPVRIREGVAQLSLQCIGGAMDERPSNNSRTEPR